MVRAGFDNGMGWTFLLTVGELTFSEIVEVEGIELAAGEVDEEPPVLGHPERWRRPKRPGAVTVTRYLTGDSSWNEWVARVASDGSTGRADGSVLVLDYLGGTVLQFNFVAAFPRSIAYGSCDVGDDCIVTERLTIAYESAEIAH